MKTTIQSFLVVFFTSIQNRRVNILHVHVYISFIPFQGLDINLFAVQAIQRFYVQQSKESKTNLYSMST